MIKHIRLTFEESDFNEFVAQKEHVETSTGKTMSWEKFFQYALAHQKK